MTCVDCHNRPFIVVRTINKFGIQSIDVIFQRYSNNTKKNWACAKSGFGFTQPHMNIMTNNNLQQKNYFMMTQIYLYIYIDSFIFQ